MQFEDGRLLIALLTLILDHGVHEVATRREYKITVSTRLPRDVNIREHKIATRTKKIRVST